MGAWLDAFARGIAMAEAGRAGGGDRRPRSDEIEALLGDATVPWWAQSGLVLGYHAGLQPDEPPLVPVPLPLALATAAADAVVDANFRVTLRRRRGWARAIAAWVPLALLETRLFDGARRRRAQRMGLRRRTDAPPARLPPGRLALMIGPAAVRAWDARRRGRWPSSAATIAGVNWAFAIDREGRWRRDLREWRARG